MEVLRPRQPPPAVRSPAEEKPVGPSLVKVNRLPDKISRIGHGDHGGEEAAFAVFALEFTLVSCERQGRVSSAEAFVPDHAREVKGNFGAVLFAGYLKSLFEKEFILRGHVRHGHCIPSPAA